MAAIHEGSAAADSHDGRVRRREKSECVVICNCCRLDPLSLLTDEAQIAQWNNEGLPSDRVSIENATIMLSAKRWPLMIDPQLQGIKWVKQREGESLRVVRIGTRGLSGCD